MKRAAKRPKDTGIMALGQLKGVYTMNPTDAIMKPGSRANRAARSARKPINKVMKPGMARKGKTK